MNIKQHYVHKKRGCLFETASLSISVIGFLVIVGERSFNNLNGFALIVVFGTFGPVALFIIAFVLVGVFFSL